MTDGMRLVNKRRRGERREDDVGGTLKQTIFVTHCCFHVRLRGKVESESEDEKSEKL
jgi:hypothetical protein